MESDKIETRFELAISQHFSAIGYQKLGKKQSWSVMSFMIPLVGDVKS